jgi:hypothetical protein
VEISFQNHPETFQFREWQTVLYVSKELTLEIVLRRQTPLAGNPITESLKQPQAALDRLLPAIARTASLCRSVARPTDYRFDKHFPIPWMICGPLTLNHWLRTQAMLGYKGGV